MHAEQALLPIGTRDHGVKAVDRSRERLHDRGRFVPPTTDLRDETLILGERKTSRPADSVLRIEVRRGRRGARQRLENPELQIGRLSEIAEEVWREFVQVDPGRGTLFAPGFESRNLYQRATTREPGCHIRQCMRRVVN
jgi:hypothetical protein